MKPIEYIRKYKLNETNRFSHNDFLTDLTMDFMSQIEFYSQVDWSLTKFDNIIVKQIKQKWDSISNKTVNGGLPDKLWGYFYATVVAPTKEKMFKDQIEYNKAEKERKKAEWEERKRNDDPFYGFDFFSFLLANMTRIQKPVSDFTTLGLDPENSTEDDVKKAYRNLAMAAHPDKGGTQEKFMMVTDAKNKCLTYLSKV